MSAPRSVASDGRNEGDSGSAESSVMSTEGASESEGAARLVSGKDGCVRLNAGGEIFVSNTGSEVSGRLEEGIPVLGSDGGDRVKLTDGASTDGAVMDGIARSALGIVGAPGESVIDGV